MSRQRILEEWNSFSRALNLEKASPVQRVEMQKAFFSGAMALFALIMNILEPGADPTDKDLQVMDEIFQEMKNYPKRVVDGRWTMELGNKKG